jgi:hypothetical protein
MTWIGAAIGRVDGARPATARQLIESRLLWGGKARERPDGTAKRASIRVRCPRKPNLLSSSVVFFGFSVNRFGVAQKVCFCAFCVPDHRKICLLVCRSLFFLWDFCSVAPRRRHIRPPPPHHHIKSVFVDHRRRR